MKTDPPGQPQPGLQGLDVSAGARVYENLDTLGLIIDLLDRKDCLSMQRTGYAGCHAASLHMYNKIQYSSLMYLHPRYSRFIVQLGEPRHPVDGERWTRRRADDLMGHIAAGIGGSTWVAKDFISRSTSQYRGPFQFATLTQALQARHNLGKGVTYMDGFPIDGYTTSDFCKLLSVCDRQILGLLLPCQLYTKGGLTNSPAGIALNDLSRVVNAIRTFTPNLRYLTLAINVRPSAQRGGLPAAQRTWGKGAIRSLQISTPAYSGVHDLQCFPFFHIVRNIAVIAHPCLRIVFENEEKAVRSIASQRPFAQEVQAALQFLLGCVSRSSQYPIALLCS